MGIIKKVNLLSPYKPKNFIKNEWYVYKTISGYESNIINTLRSINKFEFDYFIPLKEVIHKKRQECIRLLRPLFPGYVFLNRSDRGFIDGYKNICNKYYIYPIVVNNKVGSLKCKEVEFIDSITNSYGVAPLSKLHINNQNEIEIKSGPLVNREGRLIFINKKKLKAKLAVSVNNNTYFVSLGFDMVY